MEELYRKLINYSKQGYCPMHMPGHKRNVNLLGNKLPYNIDITEIEGFDDLHHSDGVIKNIQEKAKEIFGSKRSYILVNGSTCGILAGIRACVKPGDKIAVARNCHKSVYHAIELNQLNPIYIMPKIDEFGIDKNIEPKQVEEILKQNKDVKLLVVTSPTYEGIISNLPKIVEIAHSYNVPILVDEAHGAHLQLMKEISKYEAVKSGADIVIQSLHKTLPALTQCGVLHIAGNLVKEHEVERQLSIFETSSPSYILMTSIEECLAQVEKHGEKWANKYEENLQKFYAETKKMQHLKILGNEIKEKYDNGKIVIITANTNITGKELSNILREKYKIELEMANTNYAIAMTSICDEKENFERLQKALQEIDENLENVKTDEEKINYKNSLPEQKMTIVEAINEDKGEFVNYKKAEGIMSKEYIGIYPPGIPLVVPGEVISKEIIKKLETIEKSGLEIRTTENKFPYVFVENVCHNL